MGGRSSFMVAQIRGDEKSGTAAQTPSLIDLEISRERTENGRLP